MSGRCSRLRLVVAGLIVAAVASVMWRPQPLPQPQATPPENPPGRSPDTPPEKPRPCRATFERVEKGMTRDQVAATVGGGPGTYARGEAGRDYVLAPRGLGWSNYD